MDINGCTKVYGLIGNPIRHSLSPAIHNRIASDLQINMVYVPFETADLDRAVSGARSLGISGFNITTPYKKDIVQYLAGLSKDVEELNSCNTLKLAENGFCGYNTDIKGISSAITDNKVNITGKTAVVLGAGGTASSALRALIKLNPSKIFIANRTKENAIFLANSVDKYYNFNIDVIGIEALRNIGEIELIVQTTACGFGTDETPVPVELFPYPVRNAVDLIYNPFETVFMKQCKSIGANTFGGFHILFRQAVASFEIWNDLTVDKSYSDKLFKEFNEKLKSGGIL